MSVVDGQAAEREGPVRLTMRGAVAVLRLDRPPANALSPEVVEALRARWDAVASSGSVRALIVASANPATFCAGADIKAFLAMDEAAAERFVERMHALLLDWARSPIVTIAAVAGVAYGGGCELAMAADLRVAAESARFAQPEIKLGLIPGFGGTQRLPRLIGAGRALELNLTGDPIDAAEAARLGLVGRVVPDAELDDAALSLAERLAQAPPIAIAELKRLAADAALEAGLAAERAAFARVFASDDAREGTGAFVEKRAPRFGGS
jgi:enoyl-CoA hydratase / 3-hydroxyacyl-CoA dehydrogenase